MPRQAATTGSLPQAFEGVKEMQAGQDHQRPSNDGSARSADEHGPREPSGTGPRRTASSTRSSSTKTGLGESVPRSP